ncbi:phenylacetate--CoA ligase family protein [Desulfothermus naphthae]
MIKRFAKKLYKKMVPFPYNLGFKFAKVYNELLKTQWWSKEKLEQLQLKKLRLILEHAYKNVPFYRQIFKERGLKPEDIRNLEDIRELPFIITKDQIQNNLKLFLARNMDEYAPWPFETGGSTGKPLRFYNDRISDLMESAFVWRYRVWAGYTPNDRQVIMRYKTDFPPSTDKEAPRFQDDNILYLSAFHVKESNLNDYVSKIRTFKPKAIWSFPSTLYIIAKYMLEQNISPFEGLKCITTSSETLFPHFRSTIEKAFGAKIYDWYGSNERVVSAAECEEGRMHINSEYGLLEVVNAKGEPVKPGEIGIIIGTAFHKLAMPFIRYQLGDMAILSDEKCLCGRGLPIIQSIEGRMDDLIITKDGRFVGRLDEAFHESFGIKMSQIIQKQPGSIIVKIVRGKNFSPKDIEKLYTQLQKRLGKDMEIKYEFVEEIARVGRGKYRFVISEIDIGKIYR